MATAAYFSIKQTNAFRILDEGDVTVGTSDQAGTAGTIEIALSEVDTNSVTWTRAEVLAAIDNLRDYIVNTYQYKGGAVTLKLQ